MEGYVMEGKRLTPTIVGKIASKRFVVVVVMHKKYGTFQSPVDPAHHTTPNVDQRPQCGFRQSWTIGQQLTTHGRTIFTGYRHLGNVFPRRPVYHD